MTGKAGGSGGNKRSPLDGKLGVDGRKVEAREDESLMLKRVLGAFKPGRRLLVINDEAHHCYLPRAKGRDTEEDNSATENERAAVWFSGVRAVARRWQVRTVVDLSATPYYLSGSGWPAYSHFPWVVSDFGLIEAIEAGLVKIPFLPVDDSSQAIEEPVLRNLYEHCKADLPRKGQRTQRKEDKAKVEDSKGKPKPNAAYEPPPREVARENNTPADSSANPRITYVQAPAATTAPAPAKDSLLKDVATIIKQTFRGERRKELQDNIAARPYTYYPESRDRTPLTDSQVKSPVGKDFSLLSQAARDGEPIIYAAKPGGEGFFKQVFGSLKAPQARSPKRPKSTNTSAAYGDVTVAIYEDTVPFEKELERAKTTHDKSVEILEDIARDIRKDKLLDFDRVNHAVDGLVQSIVCNPNALIWLSRLKRRDNYSYGHAIDVSIYMIAFGRHLGFPKDQLNHLGVSGLLQDIGKIKLPVDLLEGLRGARRSRALPVSASL